MNTISEVVSSEDDGGSGGKGSSSDVSHAGRPRSGRGSSAAFVNYNRVRLLAIFIQQNFNLLKIRGNVDCVSKR